MAEWQPLDAVSADNPCHRVHRDVQVVIAPLLHEEDLAAALIAGLPSQLREQAAIAGPAPGDIVTGTSATVDMALQPPGVPASRLPRECQEQLSGLLGIYVGRLAPLLAAAEEDMLAGSDPAFAFVGAQGDGRVPYHRIQAPRSTD
jgi:hypothetical protein